MFDIKPNSLPVALWHQQKIIITKILLFKIMKSNDSLNSKNCRRMQMISACDSGMSIPIKIFLNKTLPTCNYFCFTRLNSFITPYHFTVLHLTSRTFHLPPNQHRNITWVLLSINLPTPHLSQFTAAEKKDLLLGSPAQKEEAQKHCRKQF